MKVLKLVPLAVLAFPFLAHADYTVMDGKNMLKIGGQLRTQYNTGVSQDPTTSFLEKKFNEVTVETANIHLAGAINEKLIYKMRLKLAPQMTGAEETDLSQNKVHNTYNIIDYAFAGYTFSPLITVAIGKVPWGIGFDNQSSAMSPLSFAQDADFFYGSGTTNGIYAFGGLSENIDWGMTAVNDVSSQKAQNTNRSMDYSLTLAHHTKDAADAEGYNVGGAFKSYVAFDYAQVNRNGENRKVYAGSAFFSCYNSIIHAGMTTETTPGRKDDFWTFGTGYLIDKTWRPAITYTSVRSESLLGVKGKHGIAALNLTQFHDDNRWRSFVEVSTISKSDEAKASVRAAGAQEKSAWKASVGLTLNL